jgi:DnaJ-class molecular chaperone
MAKCVCGSSDHEAVTCPQCNGKGRKGGGAFSSSYECSHCKGTGKKCPKGK